MTQSQKSAEEPEDAAVHESQAVLVHFSDHTRITHKALGI